MVEPNTGYGNPLDNNGVSCRQKEILLDHAHPCINHDHGDFHLFSGSAGDVTSVDKNRLSGGRCLHFSDVCFVYPLAEETQIESLTKVFQLVLAKLWNSSWIINCSDAIFDSATRLGTLKLLKSICILI